MGKSSNVFGNFFLWYKLINWFSIQGRGWSASNWSTAILFTVDIFYDLGDLTKMAWITSFELRKESKD